MNPFFFIQLFVQSLLNITNHKMAYCPFCEAKTLFISTDRKTKRGSMYCVKCHSWSRQRHIAVELCRLLNIDNLSKLAEKQIKIYSAGRDGALDRRLMNSNNYTRSIFLENIPLGVELEKGLFCQNLEKLSFESESFDIVITEDVLEHVRLSEHAFNEIYRVLKPKGCHIFTVPINLKVDSIDMVDSSGNNDVYLRPPEYHSDSLRKGGALVYRKFGKDTPKILEKIGFTTKILKCNKIDANFGIYDSVILLSKKCC